MREYAAVHGLFVEFRGVPGRDHASSGDKDHAGHDTIYYGKRLPASRKKREMAYAWRRGNEGWVSVERRCEVPRPVSQLPARVLAAGVDEGSCGVYWREAGGVEAVEQIRQLLEVWAGELRA